MALADKSVLVIGGGAAGLAAALELAGLGVQVDLVDKAPFLGGNAAGFACKAADRCVKCGACMVEERIAAVIAHPRVRVLTGTRVQAVGREDPMTVDLARGPLFIDPQRCTGCGRCLENCPAQGALRRAFSGHNRPPVALEAGHCLFFRDGSCARCREVCPEGAVDLEKQPDTLQRRPDAVILATGFSAFSPENKPYGYGSLADVVTNLQLEEMLRTSGLALRPSDGLPPGRLAFIQCVGSRDATRGHLWCSKVCCASALRMARVIRGRQPETEITFFYIDVQTFGRDFDSVYADLREALRMKRTIPADIVRNSEGRLEVTYFDGEAAKGVEELFDMVVLSVGLTPRADAARLAAALGLTLAETGFVAGTPPPGDAPRGGVFPAGTARGPMSIAESIADAGRAAWEAVTYLNR